MQTYVKLNYDLLVTVYVYICVWAVFENRVRRRRFGPERDEVTGEWRRLHNEELLICTHHQILFW
jgi:hypothetical protein